MIFNNPFEVYWFKEGQFKNEVNLHFDMQECLKKTAKYSFDFAYKIYNTENAELKAKLKEYELKYDNE